MRTSIARSHLQHVILMACNPFSCQLIAPLCLARCIHGGLWQRFLSLCQTFVNAPCMRLLLVLLLPVILCGVWNHVATCVNWRSQAFSLPCHELLSTALRVQ